MTTEVLPLVETSNVGYRGFQVPEPLKWEGLRRNFGRQAYEASLDSQSLTVWLSFYHLGRDIVNHEERGEVPPKQILDLPEGDQELGKALYLDCQRRAGLRDKDRQDHRVWRGIWFNDAVDYNAKKPVGTIVPKGYVFAEFIKGIEDWEVDEDKGLYIPLGGTRIPVEMPISSGAFAVPVGSNTHDPLTGVPRKVEPDEKKALKAWMDSGFSKTESENELSRVYTTDSGIAVVWSLAFPDFGPLYLNFLNDPWSRDDNGGSVAASRLPSGARRDSKNVVPQKEYNTLLAQNRDLASRVDKTEAKLVKLRNLLDRE